LTCFFAVAVQVSLAFGSMHLAQHGVIVAR
jgi:magnesium-transporting ATPase (P-type)